MTAIVPFGAGELFSDRGCRPARPCSTARARRSGSPRSREWGVLETPIFLTSSMAIGRVYDARGRGLVELDDAAGDDDALMPVVGGVRRRLAQRLATVQVDEADVRAALADAVGRRARARRRAASSAPGPG